MVRAQAAWLLNLRSRNEETGLLAKLLEHFGAARAKRVELVKDPAYVDEVLRKGAEKARAIAGETMRQVKKATGLAG